MPPKPLRLWAVALTSAAALTACETYPVVQRPRSMDSTPVIDRADTSAKLLAGYVDLLQRLVQGAPAQQAEILVTAQREYQQTPTPSKQLKYALVLAAPNHSGTDLPRAQKLLRELLASPETLLPVEKGFAFLELQKVDKQVALVAENQRLQSGSDRVDRERLIVMNRKLQSELDENLRLRKALDEANAKLNAIANIEQSINERKSGTEGRSP